MLNTLLTELQLTLRDPRLGARRVMALQLPLPTAWAGLVLVAVLAAVLGYLGFAVSAQEVDPAMQSLFGSPLQSAVVQGLLQAIAAVLLFVVGRQFGGHGSFAQSVALTAWSGVPMVALQAVQLLALAIAPPLAAVAGMVAVVVNFWLITLFACELHGFRRPWLVLAAILGLSVLLAMAFIMVISIFFGVPPDV